MKPYIIRYTYVNEKTRNVLNGQIVVDADDITQAQDFAKQLIVARQHANARIKSIKEY